MKYHGMVLFAAMTLSAATGTASASAEDAATCPTVTVTGAQDGESGAKFVVNVAGADDWVTYNWSVSAGWISSGQGTSVIVVEEVGEPGTNVTATVDLGGLPPECNRNDSWTVEILAPE